MNKSYKTRIIIVFLLFFSIYVTIAINLFMIQIMKKDFFENLGKKQYDVSVKMQQERAPIADRTGKSFFAMNKDCFSAFVLPRQLTKDKKASLIKFLNKNYPKAITRLEKSKKSHFMFVQRKLSDEQIEFIKNSKIEDIYLLKEQGRFYPIESASTTIGLTDIDNFGISGLEMKFNSQLAGEPTTVYLEKDARSGHFHFKKETKIKGKTAIPLILTLSSDLQFLATEELKEIVEKYNAKEAAAIIMDPKNGDILALINYPYFDPNDTKSINPDNSKNKIITECFELGSVMKIPAALAALEEYVVTPDELIDCKNTKSTYIDGRKINTVAPHGIISFSEIVERSNNIGIAIVAKRVGEKIYDHYIKMGFGVKTNIEFPGEQSGFVNPPNNWSKQSIISLSYGYEATETLLQIANFFCMIANDGIPIKPRLILPAPTENEENLVKNNKNNRTYSEKSVKIIKYIMENTTLKGTCKRARIKGYRIMCKTGTANLLQDGKYSQNDNIFTCAGIIEKDLYQRVIVVFVKEIEKKGVHADTVAVPLFEKIAEKTLIHDKII